MNFELFFKENIYKSINNLPPLTAEKKDKSILTQLGIKIIL